MKGLGNRQRRGFFEPRRVRQTHAQPQAMYMLLQVPTSFGTNGPTAEQTLLTPLVDPTTTWSVMTVSMMSIRFLHKPVFPTAQQ